MASKIRLVLALSMAAGTCMAQPLAPPSRVHAVVEEGRRVTLRGSTHPLAQGRFDRGAAPESLALDRIILVLARSQEQDAELAGLLEDLHDPASPQFHRWLTPAEFGERFGPSDNDLQAVASWLVAHGFQVEPVGPGRNLIEFSGTARQVLEAFRAPIRHFVVEGEAHWANGSEISIPAALAPVVAGLAGLHDFHSAPLSRSAAESPAEGAAPLATFANGVHALAPADFATIYNVRPLYQSGVTGAGSTIAVLGRTNINVQDVADFRQFFGLGVNPPQVILNGPDPGIVSTGEQMEAILDTTWSGAVAPGATVKLIVSKSTNTTDGVLLSEIYAINHNIADILSESFGTCEAWNTGSAAALNALAQQAAAQGVTYVVSSGDSGSAGCDDAGAPAASGGLSVNILASNPYTIAVGGTQLNDAAAPSQYWNAQNGSGYGSAKSYIPESVWNQSCAAGRSACSQPNLWAGGGGASSLYGKPSWQAGVSGIPADGRRDLPDVSFTSSTHDPYLVCMSGSCRNGGFYAVGGTSAAAPAFAGILALARQKNGARLGQANTVLYRLAAAQSWNSCNGSSTAALPGAGCVFHDVTAGNNAVPGEAGYGTSAATYTAGAGYDRATGLGSVDAYNLISAWGTGTFSPTTTALSLSPLSIAAGGSATVSIRVTPRSGAGTCTGTVSVLAGGAPIAQLTLAGGTAIANVGGWPGGVSAVTAHYNGDNAYAPSDSGPATLTVTPRFTLSPTALAFPDTKVGSASLAQSVSLTNSGAAPLTAIVVGNAGANSGDFIRTSTCLASLAPSASCTVTVTFKPAAEGARSGVLTVSTAAGSLSVGLSGKGGIATPTASITPASLSFPSIAVGGTSTASTVTLANTGTATLAINSLSLGGVNANNFGGSTTCRATLAPGGSCTVSLWFTPTATGSRTGILSLSTNAPPLVVALAGTGLSPAAKH